jgi:hypothetical protein
MIPALLLVCSGCGGIAAGGAASIMSILPYLLKAEPARTQPDTSQPDTAPATVKAGQEVARL